MIYTKMTNLAIRIAYKAHEGQTDECDIPYFLHPYHLAEQMTDEATTCVALLHDVVEDTDVTFKDLENYGFGEEIITALRYLTHDKSVAYMDYILKIKENPIAMQVKLADLKHNSDLSRYDEIEDWMPKRNEKYIKAIELLTASV